MVALSKASVLPRHLVVLIAPVALLAAIEARELWQQGGQRFLLHELQRFLAVEIEDALAVDKFLPVDVVLWVEGLAVRLELRGLWRGRRKEFVEMIEVPDADGVVHAQTRDVALARLHHTARDAHVIEDAVAADGALHEAAEGKATCLGCAGHGFDGLVQHLLAIHPEGHAFVIHARQQVVPLAVADVHLGVKVAAAAGQVEGEGAALRMRVELPMRGGGFGIGGDEDVEVLLAVQLGAAFDGDGQRAEGFVVLLEIAALQGLAKFRAQ